MSRLLSRRAIQRVESEILIIPTLTLSAPTARLYSPFAAAVACTVVADWLFYGHSAGISFVIFLTLLACLSAASNTRRRGTQPIRMAWLLFAVGQLTLFEDVNALSLAFGLMSLAVFISISNCQKIGDWRTWVPGSALALVSGSVQCVLDCVRLGRLWRHAVHVMDRRIDVAAWVVPLGIGTVFLVLFQQANPLIDKWVTMIDLRALEGSISVPRILFWVFVFITIWPAVRVHRRRVRVTVTTSVAERLPLQRHGLLGESAMTRSLVLFNLLFAIQSVMDLAYLWGGLSLPDGISYATYAHRGAYPLMATALLAGAFVLTAMRAGPTAPSMRMLLLAWTGQNILLVLSSILRLHLYIAAYSLTEWRVAALVWMILVAIGLALIAAQIVRDKTSAWLLSANALVLILTLYGCCFVDFPSVIAGYNVRHARECGGNGPPLDVDYLLSLPPHALLALDQCGSPLALTAQRDEWVALHRAEDRNWRGWTFRSWRLDRYLANLPPTP